MATDLNGDPRSVPSLISDLAQQATHLIQTEARLLRAEMSEKLTLIGTGTAEVAAGAICLLAALLVLLQALVVALAKAGLGAGWASLLVGVVVALVGVFLIRNGSKSFDAKNLSPDKTQGQLRQDVQLAKDQVK